MEHGIFSRIRAMQSPRDQRQVISDSDEEEPRSPSPPPSPTFPSGRPRHASLPKSPGKKWTIFDYMYAVHCKNVSMFNMQLHVS